MWRQSLTNFLFNTIVRVDTYTADITPEDILVSIDLVSLFIIHYGTRETIGYVQETFPP